MQTSRITKVKKSYKIKTLLFAAELSIKDLFIHNTHSTNVPSNFGMSATVKSTKLWPSKCTWHHDCVCGFPYITLDKTVSG
jgi:hypothetical protein